MNLRLFILEDEGPALARLVALLAEAAPEAVVAGTADSVRAGSDWLDRHPAPDLILADIQLSDGLSLDLFRARSPGCPVVFTTAHDTFLLEAFATHGIAYLLKPIKVADLAAALQKHRDLARLYTAGVAALTQQLASTRPPGPPAPRRRFLAQKGIAFQPIPIDEVAYFFSEHKLTFLVTHRAQRHLVNDSLATLEAELAPGEFFRLGRGILAHISAIRSFRSVGKGRLAVELQPATADEVQISQERAAEFRAWVGR
jgi:DNA-binding LytR/AlgR family response regulator